MSDLVDTAITAIRDLWDKPLHEAEDMVTNWLNRAFSDEEWIPAEADLLAAVLMDALRQLAEQNNKEASVRIIRPEPGGYRMTYTWPNCEPTTRTFTDHVIQEVKAHIKTRS